MSALEERTIVVTRAEAQAPPLVAAFEAAGANVITTPSIRFVPHVDADEWSATLNRRPKYTHVVFTSPIAVRFFAELCEKNEAPLARWKEHARFSAVGAKTAARLEQSGIVADVVGDGGGGDDLAHELVASGGVGPGSRVLLPQSLIARPEAAQLLLEAGAGVDALTLYATESEDAVKATPLIDALDRGDSIDVVTFASPSAVRGFLAICGERGAQLLRQSSVRVVSIGRTTSGAVRDAGMDVDAEAKTPSVEALVDAAIASLGA
jgi:uroporphyrinogen-III synthase